MLLFHPKHEELTIESDVINYCQARILSLLSMGDKASWYDIFTVYCHCVWGSIYINQWVKLIKLMNIFIIYSSR